MVLVGVLEGYYLDNADRTCKPCQGNCATCTGGAVTNCETCKIGYYLKGDNSCSDTCDQGYADPESRTCKLCTTIDQSCTACKYNATVSKPQCTICGSSKKVKTALDGTTTCVDVATGCKDENHFQAESNAACYLCGENASGSGNDKGIANCKTCTKSGAPPQCSACLDGYFYDSSQKACTQQCATNCATCSEATNPNKCLSCKAGYFLVDAEGGKKCVACDSIPDGGREGCSACSNDPTFKCADCRANYRKQPNGGAADDYTCTKACEDDSACGGTAGSCGAIVVGGDGSMKHYCSYCGESTKFPIDGICTTEKSGNTCENGVCTQCAAGYFLYMGGCYKVDTEPGSLMCTAAPNGICTAATSQYFAVPGAKATDQSVLGCGNPLGTNTTSTNAYVGVEGCKTCGAAAASECASCFSGYYLDSTAKACKKCSENSADGKITGVDNCISCDPPSGNQGSVTCYVKTSDGGSGDNSTGSDPKLSSGAIAGISVAVIVMVGGLVGFLCWWFICRGKA